MLVDKFILLYLFVWLKQMVHINMWD